MKRFNFLMILMIYILILPNTAYAHDFEIEYKSSTFASMFSYKLYFNILSEVDKTVELTFKNDAANGMDYMGRLEIPEKVIYKNVEYTVTTVGKNTFDRADGLIILKLPETVKYINCNFKDCINLKYILGISELKGIMGNPREIFSLNSPIGKISQSFLRNQDSLFIENKKNDDEIKKSGRFEKEIPLASLHTVAAKIKEKWGIIDYRGKLIIPFEYEDFYEANYSEDYEKVDGIEYVIFCMQKNGKWGYVDLANNIVLPFTNETPDKANKSKKTAFKKVQKNYQNNSIYKQIYQRLLISEVEYCILLSQRQFILDEKIKTSKELAKEKEIACRVVPYLDSINQLWGFREMISKKNLIKPIYKDCINMRNSYLISEDNIHYGLLKDDGKTKILELEYTISPINKGYYYFSDNKVGLINSEGKVVLECIYDDIIFAKRWIGSDRFYIIKDGKWGLASDEGILKQCKYDGIGIFHENRANIYYMGYAGVINILGQEIEGIAKTLFDKVYNMKTNTDGIQKIHYYLDVIAIDKETKEGHSGAALNNIGVIYESMGENEKALYYYNLAQLEKSNNGQENFKRLKRIIKTDKLNAILNTLGQTLQSITGNLQTSGEGNFSNGSHNNSFKIGQGNSNYQGMYEMWEKRAESNYRSLTNLGVSFKNTKTNERVGSTGQSMNTGNYIVMKKNLREAQNQMRNIRQKAQNLGVVILQSHWESATVKY